jgi:hypothetical protein
MPTRGDGRAGVEAARRSRLWPNLAGSEGLHVGLVTFAVTAVHVTLAHYSPGAIQADDSMGYLGNARALAGAGAPINFDFSNAYSVGYSLFFVPIYRVTSDPHNVFLWALAVNITAAASITIAAYLLARNVFSLSHRGALMTGALAATYPAYLLQSGQVWPEVVLAALVAWWAVLLARFLENGSIAAAAGCGLVTGFAWATHRRMAAMVLVTFLVLAFVGWRRRNLRLGAAGATGVTLALMALTYVLERWLHDRLWTTPPANQESTHTLLANLAPTHWGDVALVALGESWYLTAASVGLTALGVVSLARYAVIRRRLLWNADPGGVVALATLCAALGTIFIGAAYIGPTLARADFLVYGRYVDEFAGVLIVAAAALIAEARRITSSRIGLLLLPVAFLLLSALVLYDVRGRAAFAGNIQKLVIPGILGEQALVEGRTVFSEAIHIRPITLIAGVTFIALLVLVRLAPAAAFVAATTAFVVLGFLGANRSLHPFLAFWNDAYRCIPTAVQQRYGSSGELAIDLQGFDAEARNRYQFLLPHYRLVYFDGSRQRPPAKLVVAPHDWPSARSDGFIAVTGELVSSEALWASTRGNRRQVPVTLASGARCPSVSVRS